MNFVIQDNGRIQKKSAFGDLINAFAKEVKINGTNDAYYMIQSYLFTYHYFTQCYQIKIFAH